MSEFDRLRGGAREPGELFVKGLELREYSEQRWPGHGLYNQPGSLFPESRGTTGQLQVARNSQRLVAAVPEKSNETFSVHSAPASWHMPYICYARRLWIRKGT
jgi:hypothetical protein